MKNLMNAKMINDEALKLTAGGNNRDIQIELDTGAPLYKVGDEVEVFISPFIHIHTNHGKILGVVRENAGWYCYLILLDNGDLVEKDANEIERN